MFVETLLLLAACAFAFTAIEFWRAPNGWQDIDGFHTGLPEARFQAFGERSAAGRKVRAYCQLDGRRISLINPIEIDRFEAKDRAGVEA